MLLPSLEDGITLLDVDGDRGVPILQSLVLDHLLFHDGPAFWIDANGHATTATLTQIVPSQRLLNRIHVARGFTAYQHYGAVCDLPTAVNKSIQMSTADARAAGRGAPSRDEDTSPHTPALIVAPAVDAQYRADDTLGETYAETLQARTLAQLATYAEGYDIQQVYGSSAAEAATGEILRVNTLFASPTEDGRTRGVVVLVQVDQTAEAASMELRASWENRQGTEQETTTTLSFPAESPEYFDNTGVRKAVLLSRYADLLKNWMVAEQEPSLAPAESEGIEVPDEDPPLGEWEQQSEPLTVSEPYPGRIRTFREHFRSEADAIGDDALDRESELLGTILASAEDASTDGGA